jgi:hypothetical protein
VRLGLWCFLATGKPHLVLYSNLLCSPNKPSQYPDSSFQYSVSWKTLEHMLAARHP